VDNGREDKNPWVKWFWSDYLSDTGLASSSLAAQGLWMRMLSIMAKSKIVGFMLDGESKMESKTLAKLVGEEVGIVDSLLAELKIHNVYSQGDGGVIFNRRMARTGYISEIRAESGRKGGRPKSKTKAKLGKKQKLTSASASEYASDSYKGGEGGKIKFEPRHLELAKFLESKVRENVPYHKFTGTNYLESWAREFRLMEDRDKIPFQDIKSVLERCLEDEFWRINILSAGTFREKFGRLAAKVSGNNRRDPDPPQTGASIQSGHDIFREAYEKNKAKERKA